MTTTKITSAMLDDKPVDVSQEVNFIWSVANKLRGTYQSDKYKDVIIPMTIIRRFECALAPTKATVVAKHKTDPDYPAKAMYKISGYQFYNTSEYTLAELCNDSDNLAANFKSYIESFSPNVSEILTSSQKGLDFNKQIEKMDANNRLFSVVKAFSEIDLDPMTVDNIKMGYIFEELIRKFSENAEAGDHYTGRDIIRLMVDILMAEGSDDIFDDGKEITIVDQACGTGGMLSTAFNWIMRHNPTASVRLFGQEINPESYAMCLAEMLIKGQNAENIRYQDTMKADCFPDVKMRFVLENPPFGTAWGGKDAAEGVEAAVKAEAAKANSRWGAGLPGSGDMQMLFLQSAINKMDDNYGRCAIIENGSPLFTGGTASGESQIRRWMLEHDLIEAIIQLPTDLFYNTGISTYIWVLSKNKSKERRGYIQLIDASSICHQLRKALGNKRYEITNEDRNTIVNLYTDFQPTEFCKIYRNTEFIYREYTVMQPLQRSYAINDERLAALRQKKVMSAVTEEMMTALEAHKSDGKYLSPEAFMPVLKAALADVTSDKKLLEKIADGLSLMDKTAEIQHDKKGNVLYDKETKDTEIVKIDEDIDDYMAREVLPHVPDAKAFFEEDLSKKVPVIKTGAEIPFTRYFYKYQQPVPSSELAIQFKELEQSVNERIKGVFEKEEQRSRQMKDSGISWVGKVPKEWPLHPVYYYFGERKNRNSFGQETNLLSLSYGHVIKKNINTIGGLLPANYNTYNIVEPNDIIIRPTDLQNDKKSLRTGLVKEHGIMTSAYIDMRPIKDIDSRYFNYLLHSYDVKKVFYNMGNGVRQGLNFSEFSKLMVFEPPISEQRSMADFLDSKCSKIDALMKDLQQQLVLLEQYKRSIINETVNQGKSNSDGNSKSEM